MTRTRAAALAILGVIIIAVAVVAIYLIQYVTADARGAVDQREQTRADGTYRIANYDYFYDQCAAVQALEDQIANAKANTGIPADQRSVNENALKNQRDTLIRQYNANAAKTDTRGHFLASDLPYEINSRQEQTLCQ